MTRKVFGGFDGQPLEPYRFSGPLGSRPNDGRAEFVEFAFHTPGTDPGRCFILELAEGNLTGTLFAQILWRIGRTF